MKLESLVLLAAVTIVSCKKIWGTDSGNQDYNSIVSIHSGFY